MKKPGGKNALAATILVGSLSLLARGCLRRFATGAQGGREGLREGGKEGSWKQHGRERRVVRPEMKKVVCK